MARRKSIAPPADPFPKEEVYSQHGPDADHGGEDLRGLDGKPVYPGSMVKRREYFSERHGHYIPESWGRVLRMYRQTNLKNPDSSCDVTIQTEDSRFFWLDTVVRSSHSCGMNDETKTAAAMRRRKEAGL
jgi:hypothetical protein